MPVTRLKDNEVARLCATYAEDFNCPLCEVGEFTDKHEGSRDWVRKQFKENWYSATKRQIHHIWKRSDVIVERHWFCSLVQVHTAVHQLHDRSPHVLELCSIRAKLERHRKWIAVNEVLERPFPDGDRLHWNPVAMSRACPGGDLKRRVELLKYHLPEVSMKTVADEILEALEGGQ